MRIRIYLLMLPLSLLVLSLACAEGDLAQATSTGDPRVTPAPLSDASTGGGLASMVQLLAQPQQFHGKRVQVIGFVHLEFEGSAIYLSREDLEYGIEKNGLWLSISESGRAEHPELNNSYAIVEGTFNADMKGHVGMWSGSIEKITMFKRWAKAKPSKIR